MQAIATRILTQFEEAVPSMPMIRAAVGHASDTSGNRQIEDFFGSVTPDDRGVGSKGMLFAIADGLSGGAGRAAAEAIVYSLLSDYYSTPRGAAINQCLGKVITAINQWLFAQNEQAGESHGMLTTLSSLVLSGHGFHIAHVGDTRIYLARDGRLRRLTTDHVWRGAKEQRVLRRALGLDEQVLVDYREGEIASGDAFVLATDGVWETVSEAEITATLLDEADAQRAAEALVEKAVLRGTHAAANDATAAVVRVELRSARR